MPNLGSTRGDPHRAGPLEISDAYTTADKLAGLDAQLFTLVERDHKLREVQERRAKARRAERKVT